MSDTTRQLRLAIEAFLDENVRSKDPEMRTKRDDLALETGRAFVDVLLRYEQKHAAGEETPTYEHQVTKLLKHYNAINADHARRDADADAVAIFRGTNGERR